MNFDGKKSKALARLLKYSDKYEISIQFWPDQTAVYIAKDGVDLYDYGGSFDDAISSGIEYLDRITNARTKIMFNRAEIIKEMAKSEKNLAPWKRRGSE